MAVEHEIEHALIGRPPSVEASHRGVAERFVEEDEATGIDPGREDVPDRAVGDDIGPVLLGAAIAVFFFFQFTKILDSARRAPRGWV